jgi:diaminopimelate decarboxylase
MYRGSNLRCESASIEAIAKRYGTPLYVYSATTIQERFRQFDQAFSGYSHTVCYSV